MGARIFLNICLRRPRLRAAGKRPMEACIAIHDLVNAYDREVGRRTAAQCYGLRFWWRRGRVELPVQRASRSNMLQACPAISSRSKGPQPAGNPREPAGGLGSLATGVAEGCTSTYGAHSPPSRRGEGGRGSRVRLPGLLYFRQLLFCRLVDEVDGTPACDSARPPPVETTRPQMMIRYSYCTTPRVLFTALRPTRRFRGLPVPRSWQQVAGFIRGLRRELRGLPPAPAPGR